MFQVIFCLVFVIFVTHVRILLISAAGFVPYGIEIDDEGFVYTTIYGNGQVHKVDPR